jgi:hypothetical protein
MGEIITVGGPAGSHRNPNRLGSFTRFAERAAPNLDDYPDLPCPNGLIVGIFGEFSL